MACEELCNLLRNQRAEERENCDGSDYEEKRIIIIKRGFSTLETAGPVVGGVTEVDKDSFWPLVNAVGDKVVVLEGELMEKMKGIVLKKSIQWLRNDSAKKY